MTLIEVLKTGKKFYRRPLLGVFHCDVVNNRMSAEFGEKGTDYYRFSCEEVLASNWELVPEPCKHEPDEDHFVEYASNGKTVPLSEMIRLIRQLREFRCKHCGVSIKAESWVEA